MKFIQLPDQIRSAQLTTEELRTNFLLQDLFQPCKVELSYVDLDRTIVGSAVPTDETLTLPVPPELRATSFTDRREIGIFNIGAPGTVYVDDEKQSLGNRDVLYVGRGSHSISFSSDDPASPAEFYLLSYPAHAVHPTTLIHASECAALTIGNPNTANHRSIRKLIHQEGTQSCQLVMGFTELHSGSVWNTMPAHTHMRRSEVYLYFDLADDARVFHFMGSPQETRHIVVANKQVVISPLWSIHAGAGTASYSFCWGMGGENQDYSDMDTVQIGDLR